MRGVRLDLRVRGKLPMDVISELMGVPESDRAELRRLADLVVHREDGVLDIPPAAFESSIKLITYYVEMLGQRRRNRADDLTSALIDAEIDGDKLTDEEIIGFMFLMVVAGNETTTKLLGNALYWGARHPDQAAAVLRDRALAPQWVEETLRYDTSSQILARTAAVDLEVPRADHPGGRPCSAARRIRQSGLPGVRGRRRVPHLPGQQQQARQLRQRHPFLPGRASRAARGQHRPGEVRRPCRGVRDRRVPFGTSPFHQCSRICLSPHESEGAQCLDSNPIRNGDRR